MSEIDNLLKRIEEEIPGAYNVEYTKKRGVVRGLCVVRDETMSFAFKITDDFNEDIVLDNLKYRLTKENK